MLSVSFVCLGNICRSPVAEAVFKNIAKERGFASFVRVRSFATSDYEEGNPVYPPAARTLVAHGITGFEHRSRLLTLADVKNSDYILVMDDMNFRDVARIAGGGAAGKIFRLGSFLPSGGDIADPYYTRDFERAYSDIAGACSAFADYIAKKHPAALGIL